MDLLPGGYTFTHIVFWTIVTLVGIGTNAVAILLSICLSFLALEAIGKVK